jgi:hypothetical protein
MKRIPFIFLILALATIHAAPQNDILVIEGRVLQKSTGAALPDVLVLLGAGSAEMTSSSGVRTAANLGPQIQNLRSRIITRNPTSIIDQAVDSVLRATGSSATAAGYAFTDSAGRFSFRNLKPGNYTIRAAREGYFGPKVAGSYPPVAVKSIELDSSRSLALVDMPLVQGAIVTGMVRTPRNAFQRPVTAYRRVYKNGKERWESILKTSTGRTGEYRLAWLPPGEVFVAAIGRYYKDASLPELATPVVLKEGQTVADIDIQPPSGAPGGSVRQEISGSAVNAFSTPDARGIVDRAVPRFILVPWNPLLQDETVSAINGLLGRPETSARASGDFSIFTAGLGGQYELVSYVKDPETKHSLVGRSAIEIKENGDLRGVSAPISQGATLSGKFTVNGPGAEQVRPESFSVSLDVLGLLPQDFVTELGTMVIDSNGFFGAIHVPMEQYQLVVGHLPAAAYVADIRTPERSVFDDGGFVLNHTTSTLQILVRTDGQTVTGTVRSPEGLPVDAATVVFLPPEQQRKNPERYRVANTNEYGQFVIQNVPPGDFKVLAWESVLPTAWMNAKFLEKYEDRARRYTISGGAPQDLQITAIPDKN